MTTETRATSQHLADNDQRDNGIILSITVELENRLRVTGAYIGPQTNQTAVEELVDADMSEHGDNHLLCGDLTAHHCVWDTKCNERGVALQAVLNKRPRT